MKKTLAMVLALVMVFSLFTACGSKTETPATTDNKTETPAATDNKTETPATDAAPVKTSITFATAVDPTSLQPMKLPKGGQVETISNIFNYLWKYKDGEYDWELCTGMDKIDNVTYDLHIREGVTFSDGHELVAEDVRYTIATCQADTSANAWVRQVDCEKTEVIDDHTLRLVMTQEYPFLFCSMQNVAIFYQEAYEASGDGMATHPIGTGPYVLDEYVQGSYLRLKARDDYWGGEVPIKEYTVRFVGEASQRLTMLRTGEADIISSVPALDYMSLESEGMTGVQILTDQSTVVYMNCAEGVTADPTVRQAVAHAIDNEGILAAVFQNLGEVCDTICSNGMSNMDDNYIPDDYYGYDLEKAKALLNEAGVEEGTPFVIAYHSASNDHKTIAEIMQADLNEIGFNTELKAIEDAAWTDYIRDHSSGWCIGVSTMNTAGSASSLDLMNLYCFIIPELGYTNEELKALSFEACASTDEQLIHDNTMKVSEGVVNEVPYYAICSSVNLLAYNPKTIADWDYTYFTTPRAENITLAH